MKLHLLLALAALLLAAHAGNVAHVAAVSVTGAGTRKMLQYEAFEAGVCWLLHLLLCLPTQRIFEWHVKEEHDRLHPQDQHCYPYYHFYS